MAKSHDTFDDIIYVQRLMLDLIEPIQEDGRIDFVCGLAEEFRDASNTCECALDFTYSSDSCEQASKEALSPH